MYMFLRCVSNLSSFQSNSDFFANFKSCLKIGPKSLYSIKIALIFVGGHVGSLCRESAF